MIYREYLVMRRAFAWFAAMLPAMLLVMLASHMFEFGPGPLDVASGSGWLAAIFASIFGVSLGNGSRQAARVLWMIPIARWKLAIQIVVVDLAGTAVAFAYAYAVTLLFLALAYPHFTLEMIGPSSAADMIAALALAYATYGWSALAGMLSRRIAYGGLIALPALMIWMIVAQAQAQDKVGSILRAPIVANPFAVFNARLALDSWTHHHFTLDPLTASLQWLSAIWATPILVAITVITSGLAVALWQRAEAIN